MSPFTRLSVPALVIAALTVPLHATVQTYSSVYINSATSVSDSEPDTATSSTGGSLELSAASTTSRAFTNGANYVIKPVTDDVFAKAALSNGILQTKAVLGLGTNTLTGGSGVPLGVRNASSSATATFADSFSAKSASTGAPFVWSNGDEAAFDFAITGQYSVPGNVASPASPGNPKNLVLGTLRFQALTPGGLELLNQLNNFDFGSHTYEEYQVLYAQYESHRIAGGLGFWYLGTPISDFPVGSDPVLTVDPSNPTNVHFAFNPNGDFEWFLSIDNTVQLDASLQNTTVTLDFSHTIQTTYTAPFGTTTLSASGVFPNTAPLPEPSLAALALATLPLARRRPR